MSEETKWVGKPVPYNIFFQVHDAEGRPFEDLKDMTFTFERIYPNDLLYTPRLHPEIREAIEEICEYISGCDDDVWEAGNKVRFFLDHIKGE